MLNTGLRSCILLNQLKHCHSAAVRNNIIIKVSIDHLLLFPQRRIISFSGWYAIRCHQSPTVHRLAFSVGIDVSELIATIRFLALSCAKNAIFIIASLYAH